MGSILGIMKISIFILMRLNKLEEVYFIVMISYMKVMNALIKILIKLHIILQAYFNLP